eukprot:CAMPEP_0170633916 /NCGR_PEP_ID=MMETSP0224-20130122/36285_1 /TAXON_ID=285029 /ORGANISM="Togula jolla, Strain CCCM 725" /LENGTH=96 /DNA_ID=CAMNT_0010963065 /DNA_START=156 /DNA_END=446 /DNA_ORIENTATION=-
MHGMLRKHGAVDAVCGVRRHGADRVGWIDILHGERFLHGHEVGQELFAEPWAHVLELPVATRIALLRALHQCLPTALGNNEDRVALRPYEVQSVRQ